MVPRSVALTGLASRPSSELMVALLPAPDRPSTRIVTAKGSGASGCSASAAWALRLASSAGSGRRLRVAAGGSFSFSATPILRYRA